jgi:hypothetical protein
LTDCDLNVRWSEVSERELSQFVTLKHREPERDGPPTITKVHQQARLEWVVLDPRVWSNGDDAATLRSGGRLSPTGGRGEELARPRTLETAPMREVLQLTPSAQLQADAADRADVDTLAISLADVNVGPGPRIAAPIRHALAPVPAT